jgi:hypothetical protein
VQNFTYNVDMALCVDATGSMSSIIERVKKSAMGFYSDLQREMTASSKKVDQLRVRVVQFRDFYADGAEAMRTSEFFQLPQQSGDFSTFVAGISAQGGGDEPENGLEALAIAMKSPWTKEGHKRRHVIVLWTDTSAHPIEKSGGSKGDQYPDSLPKTFDALTDMWDGQGHMDQNAKRLILFAPDAVPWTDIANNWQAVIHHPSQAGEGLSDVDYRTILDVIVKSL